MKTWLSCSFLSLAMVSIVTIAVPASAQVQAAKDAVPSKAAAPAPADPATAKAAAPAAPTVPAAPNPTAQPAVPNPAIAAQPTNAQLGAQPDANAAGAAPAAQEDPLKDVVIHKHPEDFATAQQLALQNRDERSTLLQKSIACVQQATNMDELTACQVDERKEMDKIRLSYCDTMVASYGANKNLPKRNKGKGKKGKNAAADDSSDTADAAPRYQKPTECDKALAAVTGRPVQRREIDPQPDAPETAPAPAPAAQ